MKITVLITLSVLLMAGCMHRSETTTSAGASSPGMTSETSGGGGSAAQLSSEDTKFIRQAAQAGMAEVRMGQLASQNAQDQALKDFGQRLVTDHTKANQELAQIASQKGATVPMNMDSSDQKMIDNLSSLSGAEFDRVCVKDAVDAHEKAIKDFKTASEECKDPDLKAFAQKTLPILQEHLDMAKKLSSSSTQEKEENK